MIQKPFIATVKTVAKETLIALGVGTVSVGISAPKKEEDPLYDISAIISFAGDYVGVCVVKLTKTLALKITSIMMGEEKSVLDDDVKDAIGEITNLVAGGMRTKMNPEGYNFNITTPNIVVGTGHRTRVPQDLNVQVIPFFFANQKMCVELGVKQRS